MGQCWPGTQPLLTWGCPRAAMMAVVLTSPWFSWDTDSPRGTRVKSEQPSYTGSEESDARHWRGGRAPDLEQEGPRVPEALGVTGWE